MEPISDGTVGWVGCGKSRALALRCWLVGKCGKSRAHALRRWLVEKAARAEPLPYAVGFAGADSISTRELQKILDKLAKIEYHILSKLNMREWLSGRASPCQGEGREFESRFALRKKQTFCEVCFFYCKMYVFIAIFVAFVVE